MGEMRLRRIETEWWTRDRGDTRDTSWGLALPIERLTLLRLYPWTGYKSLGRVLRGRASFEDARR